MARLKDMLIDQCWRMERAASNIAAAGQLMYGGVTERNLAAVELAALDALDVVRELRQATEGK